MKQIIVALALCLAGAVTLHAQQYQNDKMKVGDAAPELAFQDPQGAPLSLSAINKGRVVLVDFWASWCGPCRATSPQVVAIYNKYKDKKFKGAKNGFTIVSVSLDQNKDAWTAAIAKDGLNWPYHMSDLLSWNSKAAALYGVQFIPQAFLVGPDGKIKAMYTYAGQAEADIEKLAANGSL